MSLVTISLTAAVVSYYAIAAYLSQRGLGLLLLLPPFLVVPGLVLWLARGSKWLYVFALTSVAGLLATAGWISPAFWASIGFTRTASIACLGAVGQGLAGLVVFRLARSLQTVRESAERTE